ncbi:MAG: phosphatidylcholine/phosphatidylserine synthase [Terracidiphilus sp.]|jgi:CDP-diacylglycerol--serine O-phosphatidyltransferase
MMHPDTRQVKARARAQLRRGMFLLPSLFTVGNIAAGFFAVLQTMMALTDAGNAHTHLDWAAIAIILAIPFDGLDGRIARMTNTCSDFGKELDSLADAITFGVAPSLLALIWGFHFLPDTMNPELHENLLHAGIFICFLYLIGGVSRLARFNISHDPLPRNPGRPDRKYFVGMPIPAGAGLLAACVHVCQGYPVEAWWVALIWIGIVGVSGFLMVSTWRFWSGKELSFSRRHSFRTLFFISIALFIIIRFSQAVLFLWALVYMFSGIWARAAYSWSRRRRWRLKRAPATVSEPNPLDHS